MPAFVAALMSVVVFGCVLQAFNLLTRATEGAFPIEVMENSLIHYGGAAAAAWLVWRRLVQNQAGVVKE